MVVYWVLPTELVFAVPLYQLDTTCALLFIIFIYILPCKFALYALVSYALLLCSARFFLFALLSRPTF